MKRVNIFTVENCMDQLKETKLIKQLKNDEDFKETIVQQYNDYLKECELELEEPQQTLITYIIDKIEWLEQNDQ